MVGIVSGIDVFMEQWEYEYSQPRAYDYARCVTCGGAGDIKDLDKNYTAKYPNGKYPYYPVMKLLDAVLWEYGAILP